MQIIIQQKHNKHWTYLGSLENDQMIDKVGQFRLPIKSANKNLSSVMQKSAEFVCH